MNPNELRSKIIDALKNVYDPEISINVWDLGLIYELKVTSDGRVYLKMTLTTPSCPVAGQIITNVMEAVREVEGVKDVDAELVFDPPWDPTKITKEGREMYKQLYGRDIIEEYIKQQRENS